MIIVKGHGIGVRQYFGTADEIQTVTMALGSFGYVLKWPFSWAERTFTFNEFADAIEAVHDKTNPQTGEVLRVLRTVHTHPGNAGT